MAGWKLTIEFRDMFFLARHPTKGEVVLLPRGKVLGKPTSGHSAVMWVDDPRFSYGLHRAQVYIKDGSSNLLWGTSSVREDNHNLVSANDIFGKITLGAGFIDALPVPAALNARIVLGSGKFTDLPARDRHARFKWTFNRPDGTTFQHKVTDRLRFERNMPAGTAVILIRQDSGDLDEIPLRSSDHQIVIWNRDLREIDDEQNEIRGGDRELREFKHLHDLYGRTGSHPMGTYPGDPLPARPVGNDEPICGGEEGEPDPPPDPPKP